MHKDHSIGIFTCFKLVTGILASTIIISGCFIFLIVLILTEKMNRAIIAVSGALVTYFTLSFFEGYKFSLIVKLMFGSQSDNYVNLHSLILIVGLLFIVHISDEIGTFQFLAVIAIQASRGKPIRLMVILCTVSLAFSAILNNILTIMILIPLTITISRVLNINPTPYILTQSIVVNIGGTLFSISSIPNILIFNETLGISFPRYFFEIGLFSLFVFLFTILLFVFLYKNELSIPQDRAVEILLTDFDAYNVVQSRRLLYLSLGALILLMFSFFIIPFSILGDVLTPDTIAMTIAMVLTIASRFDVKETIKKFDFELIFYLLGIFVITGGLEIVGVISVLESFIQAIGGGNEFVQLLLILWIGAFTSALIDNVPITNVLIPVVDGLTVGSATLNKNYYYGLSIGANWGDNLTPLGDNILVLNIAKEANRPISIKTFWKLGFLTTIYQLCLATIYFILIYYFLLGIFLIANLVILLCLFVILLRSGPIQVQHRLDMWLFRFRNFIIISR